MKQSSTLALVHTLARSQESPARAGNLKGDVVADGQRVSRSKKFDPGCVLLDEVLFSVWRDREWGREGRRCVCHAWITSFRITKSSYALVVVEYPVCDFMTAVSG